MSQTPQHSPVKVSASQSQEDLKSYELVNDPMHDEIEDEDGRETEDELPPREAQISEQAQSKPREPAQNEETETAAFASEVDHRRQQIRTPEPKQRRSQRVSAQPSPTPSTPGRLDPFDWEDFENRYQKALADADQNETDLLAEFEQLVKYFNVWASASSSHDDERAVKRLQTRARYVHLSENKLKQKKEHLSEVVKAFQSALALLSTTR